MKYDKNYFTNTSEKRSEQFTYYINFLEDIGIKLENCSICDIGCAKGEFLSTVINKNNCFGIDVSKYAIQQCKKRFPEYQDKFICLDLNTHSVDIFDKFDVITLFDVIEHLNNFNNLDKFIKKNLKKGGYVVITTPNANSILRFISKENFSGEQDNTHTMLFTPYTLDFFLRKMGLEKIEISTPFSFYFKNNFITKNFLLGGQIFAVYRRV